MAYQNMPEMEWALANVLYGNAPASGKLPVRASKRFPAGHGLKTHGGLVLGQGFPSKWEMRSEVLQRIESAMDSAISESGCSQALRSSLPTGERSCSKSPMVSIPTTRKGLYRKQISTIWPP